MATKKPKKTVRPAARKLPARPKRAGKAIRKKAAVPKRKLAKKVTRKKAPAHKARVKVVAKNRARATAASTLGRPRVPGDARLDLVFRKDHQAREICAFLGVNTVRELEKFGPDEIIRRLTGPMVQTVGRIRKGLALCGRALLGDQAFAMEFRQRAAAYSQERG